jgi:hypothetical protein
MVRGNKDVLINVARNEFKVGDKVLVKNMKRKKTLGKQK